MFGSQLLDGKAEVQPARTGDVEPIIIDRDIHTSAPFGIVAMTQRIDDRFPKGFDRILRRVYPLKAVWRNPARNRQVLDQKLLGLAEEKEGVADHLPAVHELILGRPAKTGQAEPALRISHVEIPGLAKQHNGGVEDAPVIDQVQLS